MRNEPNEVNLHGGARSDVVGVLLAGGRSSRMGGGDKGLLKLGDRPLIDFVISSAAAQVERLLLNANGDPDRFADYPLPVIRDSVGGFAGPLAGILAALEWVQRHRPSCAWVASFAVDTPFLPTDFVARSLVAVRSTGADLACASSRGRTHPVFGLWPVRLGPSLREALEIEGLRKIDAWSSRYRVAHVEFPDRAGIDPFFNINAPDDLAQAERLSAMIGAGAGGADRDGAAQ